MIVTIIGTFKSVVICADSGVLLGKGNIIGLFIEATRTGTVVHDACQSLQVGLSCNQVGIAGGI